MLPGLPAREAEQWRARSAQSIATDAASDYSGQRNQDQQPGHNIKRSYPIIGRQRKKEIERDRGNNGVDRPEEPKPKLHELIVSSRPFDWNPLLGYLQLCVKARRCRRPIACRVKSDQLREVSASIFGSAIRDGKVYSGRRAAETRTDGFPKTDTPS